MSNYHILEQTDDKEHINVVFHFAVPPAATNEAGILYSNVILKSAESITSVLKDHQTDFPTEYQDMQDGKVIEREIMVQLSSATLTPQQKRDEIMNGNYLWEGYNDYKTKLFNELAITWEWYGYDGDIS